LISIKSVALFFIGLSLVLFLSIGCGMIAGVLCLRHRDIPQLIANFLNMLFFVTPVFWSVSMLGDHTWMASINPMFHILEILRQPLLGKSASWLSYLTVLTIGFILFFTGLVIYSTNRKKIAFWA
jgi:ABC-type polysaccharide/polyol phosphate export permease